MRLASEQAEQLRTHGWLCAENFWHPAEVAAMRRDLDRLKAAEKPFSVATVGDGVTPDDEWVNLQLCPLAPHSELFTVKSHAPQTVEAVSQLIGTPNFLHLDQDFLKPALHGAGTGWHQDDAYFKIGDPLHGTAPWTAVHNATVANSTLRIIPVAFATRLAHDRDPMSNHHIRC